MATRGVISFKVRKTGTVVDAVFDDTKTNIMLMYQSVTKTGAQISELLYDFSDHPPGADAGLDQNAARGALVTLDGSGSSYPLMGIQRYEWTQISGPQATLSSRTVPKPTFTVPAGAANGSVLVFQLKISTPNNKSFTDTTKVTVGSAAAGYKTISAAEAKRLIDSRSDLTVLDVSEADAFCSPEGHIPCSRNLPWDSGALQSRYVEFKKTAFIIVTAADVAQSQPAAAFLASKGYSVVHHLEDLSGWAWDTESCDEPCNGQPVADAGRNLSVDEGTRVVLDGSASSDPDGDRLTYKWVQTGGVALVALSDPASVRPELEVPDVGPAGGSLTFRLTVTDVNGGFSSDEVTVKILWVPEPGYNKISAQQAREMIDTRDDVIVVDVREESEYCDRSGHIPCSVNYPWDTGVLEAKFGQLPREAELLVVCDNGNRSAFAAEFLLSRGFAAVYDMGGLNVWPGETATCDQPCDKPPVDGSDDAFTPRGFVSRFYRFCLGRNPDDAGLSGWTAAIERGAVTGVDLARGFLFSEEFNRRNPTDEDFLIVLYRALLNREPIPAWIDDWLTKLDDGTTRQELVEEFLSSEAFANLARVYDVDPYPLDPVEAFVAHFYETALNRAPDASGFAGWVSALRNGRVSGGDLAVSFFFSPEFLNRNLADEAFLTALYRTMMNRDPDAGGLSGWLSEMNRGRSRAAVLEGFITSPEFAGRCARAGVSAVSPGGAV